MDVLFEDAIPCRFALGDAVPRTVVATLRFIQGSRLTGGSSSARVLNLEVTDETDPFFLHSLTVGEAEYAELRADQALLVDFASFPTHLLQLLESCVAAKAEASPKFYCTLTARDTSPGAASLLSIIETNPFKQLTHLSLGLRAANDAGIKRYLAQRLALARGLLSTANSTNAGLQRDVAALKEDLVAGRAAFSRLESDAAASAAAARAEANAALASERARAAELAAAAEAAHTGAAAAAAARADAALTAAQSRGDAALSAGAKSAADCARVEAELREARARMAADEADLAAVREEATRLRAAARVADESLLTQGRELASANTRNAVLSQQLEGLQALVAEATAARASAESVARNVSDQLHTFKEAYERSQEKLKSACAELTRGNEFITSQAEDVRAARVKAKTARDALATAQERSAAHEEAAAALRRDLDDSRAALAREVLAKEESERGAGALRTSLREARETIDQNAATITWLNKELTAATSGGGEASRLGASAGVGAGAGSSSSALLSASTRGATTGGAALGASGGFSSSLGVSHLGGGGGWWGLQLLLLQQHGKDDAAAACGGGSSGCAGHLVAQQQRGRGCGGGLQQQRWRRRACGCNECCFEQPVPCRDVDGQRAEGVHVRRAGEWQACST